MCLTAIESYANFGEIRKKRISFGKKRFIKFSWGDTMHECCGHAIEVRFTWNNGENWRWGVGRSKKNVREILEATRLNGFDFEWSPEYEKSICEMGAALWSEDKRNGGTTPK